MHKSMYINQTSSSWSRFNSATRFRLYYCLYMGSRRELLLIVSGITLSYSPCKGLKLLAWGPTYSLLNFWICIPFDYTFYSSRSILFYSTKKSFRLSSSLSLSDDESLSSKPLPFFSFRYPLIGRRALDFSCFFKHSSYRESMSGLATAVESCRKARRESKESFANGPLITTRNPSLKLLLSASLVVSKRFFWTCLAWEAELSFFSERLEMEIVSVAVAYDAFSETLRLRCELKIFLKLFREILWMGFLNDPEFLKTLS